MSGESVTRLAFEDVIEQCIRCLVEAGASRDHAGSLAHALAVAEAEGNRAVGLAHLPDYLDALKAGRIVSDAVPAIEWTTPVVARIDARGGLQHLGVDRALDSVIEATRHYGLAAVASRNGFTIGALSYFPRRLADEGLSALAFANAAPAVMPASGGRTPRFCTNPMAFAVPFEGGAVVIDQSSTASALVAIKQAADRGEAIPADWALGPDGQATTDPVAALAGMLLPFGGARGANVALMVELMAAGMTGADWSFDSAAFNSGIEPPSVGYFLLAIDPDRTAGEGHRERVARLVESLESDGAHVPGAERGRMSALALRNGMEVDTATWERIRRWAP